MISGTNEASLPAGFCPLSPVPSQQASHQKDVLVYLCSYLLASFMWSYFMGSSLCPFCPAVMPVPVSLYPVTLPQVSPALWAAAAAAFLPGPGVLGGSCSGSLRYLRGEDNSNLLFYYLTDFPSAQGNLISSRWLPSVQFHRNGPADIKSFYSLLLVLVIGLWENKFFFLFNCCFFLSFSLALQIKRSGYQWCC